MAQYIDSLVVEQQLTYSGHVTTPTVTATTSGTLALTVNSTSYQLFTGSNPNQVVRLPNATTLTLGQRYEIYNAASVSIAVQTAGGAALITILPNQMVTFRCGSTSTSSGTWFYTTVDQTMSAAGELFCTYTGTGLTVNYTAGNTFVDGSNYEIPKGSITVDPYITEGYIYVDPTTQIVTFGESLPNNAIGMATFTSGAGSITSLNDVREFAGRNLVWGLTADIEDQTSQSTASGGALEKYARADHVHAMNINLMKAGKIAAASFTGSPRSSAVVFATPYVDTEYAVDIKGVDVRTWSYTSKATTGFTIVTNANQALTGEVTWVTIKTGEAS